MYLEFVFIINAFMKPVFDLARLFKGSDWASDEDTAALRMD